MRTALIMIVAAFTTACVAGANTSGSDPHRLNDERQMERVQRMQDEFNALTGDAY